MELTTLHPAVHARILETFYERHTTHLWSDLSWDVLAKLNFMNYDGEPPGPASLHRCGSRGWHAACPLSCLRPTHRGNVLGGRFRGPDG